MNQQNEPCGCGNHTHDGEHAHPAHAHSEPCGCGNHTHDGEHAHSAHAHNEQCGCGNHTHNGEHAHTAHTHGESCGCGNPVHDDEHAHSAHVHDEHCGCGHTHAPVPTPDGLSPLQVDFLMALRQRQCLPVACFALAKADDAERHGVALAPVYLSSVDDSMQQVKALGHELTLLEDMELITLDYDLPLQNYAYEEYRASSLFAYFVATVEEAAKQLHPTFDSPVLELGSMALTDIGEYMVDKLLQ